MNQPEISVIIVHFNTADLLPDCLASIENSKGDIPREIFVVDNASDQGSVRHGCRRCPSVKLIPLEKNLGFGAGVNAGFAQSSAPYLLLLNPDARLGENTLGQMLDFLKIHPKAGVVGPLHRGTEGVAQPTWGAFPTFRSELIRKTVHAGVSENLPKAGKLLERRAKKTDVTDWVSGSCMLIRREAMEAVDGFDTRFFLYFEDIDLCRRIRDAGFSVHLLSGADIIHIGGAAAGRTKDRAAVAYRQSQFAFLRKYYPPYVTWLTRFGVAVKALGLWFFNLVAYLEHMPGELAKQKAQQMKLQRKIAWTALFESRAK